jgi:uncharacterized protein YjbI with pentapeptide repeats
MLWLLPARYQFCKVNKRKTFAQPIHFNKAIFYKGADFREVTFSEVANFSDTHFNEEATFSYAHFQYAEFSFVEFREEVEFFNVEFPSTDKNIFIIPIKFNHSTFRKRARFSGKPDKPLELGLVSFVGVDMDNIEFSNVKWKTKKEKLLRIKNIITRNIIIDEEHLDRNNNNLQPAKKEL